MRVQKPIAVITSDLTPGHTYEVMVAAVDSKNRIQKDEDSPKDVVTIRGKTTSPSAGSALAATAGLLKITLAWTNPTDYDFHHMEIWRASRLPFEPYAEMIDTTPNSTYIDAIGLPDKTYYYWIRAVNTSGKKSAYHPLSTATGAYATTTGVVASEIDDFAITATKLFTNTVVLTADSWTNNSPGAGSIAWNTHSIVYNGASYPITAGNTALAYVYWVTGNATYSTSATHPALGATGFMVAINTSGVHTTIWNSSANMVIGTAFIANLAVTDAKIDTLTVDKLTAGTITSKDIELAYTGAASCLIHSTGKDTFTDATAGFILGIDGADGLAKFNIGDGTNYAYFNGVSWQFTVPINANIINAGTLTGRRVQTAASGQRAVMDIADNTFRILDNAGNTMILLDDDVDGSIPGMVVEDANGGSITVKVDANNFMKMTHLSLLGQVGGNNIVEIDMTTPAMALSQGAYLIVDGYISSNSYINAVSGYKVNGVAGANFNGAVTNITVVDGLVTAAS